MTDLVTVAAIITAIVAFYGAGLSTFNFLTKRKEKRPQLQVGYRSGFIEFAGHQLSEAMIILEASNIGSIPVAIPSLPSLQIILPDKKFLIPREDWEAFSVQFPLQLMPGRSYSIYRNIQGFAGSLKKLGYSGKVKLRVICKDDVGRVYKGKRVPFDIEAWAKSSKSVST